MYKPGKTTKYPSSPDLTRFVGPYERWVFSEHLGKPFTFPSIANGTSGYYTALLENNGKVPLVELNMTDFAEVRLPPLWNPSQKARNFLPISFFDPTANDPIKHRDDTADIQFLLSQIQAANAQAGLLRYRLNFPISPQAWVPSYQDHKALPASPHRPKAILAIIDDGLPFANRAFRRSDGSTRIDRVWLQAAEARPEDTVPFGKEVTSTDIDNLVRRFGTDEGTIYRSTGAISPRTPEIGSYLRRAATHGAHIMGLAAGSGPDLPDDIAVIAVQLPNTIAWDMLFIN